MHNPTNVVRKSSFPSLLSALGPWLGGWTLMETITARLSFCPYGVLIVGGTEDGNRRRKKCEPQTGERSFLTLYGQT
jgi:hypothetical protein